MKKLCFGTLLNLVYQAKGQGVTYKSICDAVFSAYGCADTTNRDSSFQNSSESRRSQRWRRQLWHIGKERPSAEP